MPEITITAIQCPLCQATHDSKGRPFLTEQQIHRHIAHAHPGGKIVTSPPLPPGDALVEGPALDEIKLIWLNPNEIPDAPWNPEQRVKDRSLRPLVESIRKYGFWPWEPLQIGSDGILADGHRRKRAASIAGCTRVPTIVLNITAQEYWAAKNGTQMATTIRQVGEAVAKGLEYVPPAHEKVFGDLLWVCQGDWRKVRAILERGATPSIVRSAQRIANYVGMKGEQEFIARTIRWLMKHHGSGWTASMAMREGDITPDALFDFVSHDKPLKAKW